MSDFLARVRANAGVTDTPTPSYDPALIPDLDGSTAMPRSDEDNEIDRIIGQVNVIDAYVRWIGKMTPEPGNRRESVMVSCPMPNHADTHPSAWMNLDDDVWFCGGCQIGGDIYDLAAIHFGYPLETYKTNGDFPNLRRDMAESLGYRVKRSMSGQTYVEQVAVVGAPDVEVVEAPAPLASVTTLPAPPVLPFDPNLCIDWRSIVPRNTFLWDWMEATSIDDLPEEFYFWLGLVALGFCAGGDVVLADRAPVKGNLFVCLFGASGIGKTRSIRALTELLRRALPYDHDDEYSTGAMIVATPGSAEALVDSFSKPVTDPEDNKTVVGYRPVRGLVRFDELSDLIGRAQRTGNPLKPTLMQFYDSYDDIELRSRGAGYVRAEKHFCQTITTTQPRAIRDLLIQTDADSGFVNRWIFAAGKEKKLLDHGGEELDIEGCVPQLHLVRAWCSYRNVSLVGDAREVWREFFDTYIEPSKRSDESSLTTRLDLTLKKIILLFCVNERTEVPDAGLVRRVLTLYPYLKATFLMLAKEVGIGEFEDCRQAIVDASIRYQQANDQPATLVELNRMIPKRYRRDLVARVLRTMLELQELTEEFPPLAGGKRQPRLRYVG